MADVMEPLEQVISNDSLTRVDSGVQGISSSPPSKEPKHRRQSSSVPGVYNLADLEKEGTEIELPIESQKTGWKLNTPPTSIENTEFLSLLLTKPPVKRIDLHFPLGKEVTARNMRGVTLKDAMDAIHKAYKKRADDELDKPYLAGFEWDKEECWTRLIVHTQAEPGVALISKKKKKDEKKEKTLAEKAASDV